MRRLVLFALTAALVGGCGSKMKRLSDAERDHYYALRVYMDKKQTKEFLKGKTEEERDAWLKAEGLWDRFYRYDESTRDAIVAGEVEIGWSEDMVLMSWGPPLERRRMTSRPAQRSELFVYRFEVDEEGIVRVWTEDSKTAYKAVKRKQCELYVDDLYVTEMLWKDKWE